MYIAYSWKCSPTPFRRHLGGEHRYVQEAPLYHGTGEAVRGTHKVFIGRREVHGSMSMHLHTYTGRLIGINSLSPVFCSLAPSQHAGIISLTIGAFLSGLFGVFHGATWGQTTPNVWVSGFERKVKDKSCNRYNTGLTLMRISIYSVSQKMWMSWVLILLEAQSCCYVSNTSLNLESTQHFPSLWSWSQKQCSPLIWRLRRRQSSGETGPFGRYTGRKAVALLGIACRFAVFLIAKPSSKNFSGCSKEMDRGRSQTISFPLPCLQSREAWPRESCDAAADGNQDLPCWRNVWEANR